MAVTTSTRPPPDYPPVTTPRTARPPRCLTGERPRMGRPASPAPRRRPYGRDAPGASLPSGGAAASPGPGDGRRAPGPAGSSMKQARPRTPRAGSPSSRPGGDGPPEGRGRIISPAPRRPAPPRSAREPPHPATPGRPRECGLSGRQALSGQSAAAGRMPLPAGCPCRPDAPAGAAPGRPVRASQNVRVGASGAICRRGIRQRS